MQWIIIEERRGMPGKTKYRQDSYVRCPYYCKESPIDIKCVGICGSHTINEFSSGREKIAWKEDFCIGNYQGCPLCISLIEDEK